jgi:nucleolar GTP-binding protein
MRKGVIYNPFKGLGDIPSANDLEDALFRRVYLVNVPKTRPEERRRLLATSKIKLFGKLYNQRVRKIRRIYTEVRLAHEFHRELCDAVYQEGYNGLVNDLEKVLHSSKIIETIQRNCLDRIRRYPEEADAIKKHFLGRAGSVLKRTKECLFRLNQAYFTLRELPDLDYGSYKVVVAGAPHVGKSSLVSRITNRKIEIGTYPFTTKKINAGDIVVRGTRIVVFDTPGLLDRPLERRSSIEKKAIAALRYLSNLVVFLIDPTEKAGYSVEFQNTIYESIRPLVSEGDVIKLYTHADEIPSQVVPGKYVSNTTGFGIEAFKAEIVRRALEWYKNSFANSYEP